MTDQAVPVGKDSDLYSNGGLLKFQKANRLSGLKCLCVTSVFPVIMLDGVLNDASTASSHIFSNSLLISSLMIVTVLAN